MRADYLWWYDQQLSLKYLEYIATGFSAGQKKNVNYNGGVAALTVELWYWHLRHSPPRTMRGSCLCWRARRRKASWRESWPVSSSGCGRTEVFKPASAAPANISSTTRQHSESQTHTQTTEVAVAARTVSHPLKSLNGPTHQFMTLNDKVFHIRMTGRTNCCHSTANTQKAAATS